jgi:hypothetical protein
MKKSNNLNRILEFFWLLVTVLTALMGLFSLIKHGWKSSYMFFIMTIMAFLLYLARHTLHMKEKDKADE